MLVPRRPSPRRRNCRLADPSPIAGAVSCAGSGNCYPCCPLSRRLSKESKTRLALLFQRQRFAVRVVAAKQPQLPFCIWHRPPHFPLCGTNGSMPASAERPGKEKLKKDHTCISQIEGPRSGRVPRWRGSAKQRVCPPSGGARGPGMGPSLGAGASFGAGTVKKRINFEYSIQISLSCTFETTKFV